MADTPSVESILGPRPKSDYPSKSQFSTYADKAFGAGKWSLNSGYRDPQHNAEVGGVPGSDHTKGSPDAPGAYDVSVKGLTPAQAGAKLKAAGWTGREYPEGSHLHTDARPTVESILGPRPNGPQGAPAPVTTADVVKRLGGFPQDRALAAARKDQSVRDKQPQGPLAEPTRQGMRQFTLGLSEAVPAAATAVGSQFPRLAGKDPGYSMGDRYNAERRVQSDVTKRNAGPAATAGGIAGGVGGLFTGATEAKGLIAAAKGVEGLVPRLLPAAKAGAKIGAVAGAANADRYQDVPGGVGAGGAMGAVGGAVGEVLLSGGRFVANTANTLSNNKFGSAVDAASRRLRTALFKDGVTGKKLADTMAKWKAVGVDQSLLDLGGKNVQKLIRQAGSGGDAQHVLDSYLQRTAENTGSDAIKGVEKLVGEKRPANQVVEWLEKQRAKIAQQKYPQQQNTKIEYASVLHSMVDPEVRSVLNTARKDAVVSRDYARAQDIEGIIDQVRYMEHGKAGPVGPGTVAAGTLDAIQSAFQRAAMAASKAGNKVRARALYERAAEIGSHLDSLPQLKDARRTYKIYSDMIDGFEHGADAVKSTSPDTTIAEFNKLGKGAAQTARIGARQQITNMLEGNSTSTLAKLADNHGMKRIMTAMFGSDETNDISRMAALRLQKLRNAARATGAQPEATHTPISALAHTPAGQGAHIALGAVRRAATGMSDKEAQGIASLGTTPASAALRRIAPKGESARGSSISRRAAGEGVANSPKKRRRRDDDQ